MGKIKEYNDMLGNVKGKIGDKLVADTKYGKQVKEMPAGRGTISDLQMKEMDSWGYLSGEYDKLTEEQARLWAMYANTREIRRLYTKERFMQGRNLFFSINMKLIEIGEPITMKRPSFGHAQSFDKLNIEIVEIGAEKDIIFTFSPEINNDTKLIIKASGPVKEPLLFIHPNLYSKILIADSSFKSGSSLMELYRKIGEPMPVQGQKLSFLVESVDRQCGTSNRPVKINAHLNPPKPQ